MTRIRTCQQATSGMDPPDKPHAGLQTGESLMPTRMRPVMNRTYTRGMTLLEVLVVMAILAVLAGLLYGGGSLLRTARRAACQNQLRQIGVAILLYAQDNPVRNVPGLRADSLPPCQDASGTPWSTLIAPYGAENPDLFECPKGGGYGLNPLAGAEYLHMQDAIATYTLMPAETRPTSLGSIHHPSRTLLLAESGTVTPDTLDLAPSLWEEDSAAPRRPYVAFPLTDTWSGIRGRTVTHGYDWGNTLRDSGRGSMEWDPAVRPIGRHGGVCGVVFADGSTDALAIDTLLAPQIGQPDCLFDNQP